MCIAGLVINQQQTYSCASQQPFVVCLATIVSCIIIIIIMSVLAVYCASCSQQPADWAVLSHIDCLSQFELMRVKIVLDCLYP